MGGYVRYLLPAAIALVMIALFCSLGIWQLQRKADKRMRRELYAERIHQPIQVLSPALIDVGSMEFSPLAVTGEYDSRRQFLLDNQVLDGRPGYHVITPLKIDGGETRVLVNRGWVPWGEDRSQIPDVAPPTGRQRVTGTAYVPDEDYFTLEDRNQLSHWQERWQFLDLSRFRALVEYPVQPIVIRLAPEAGAGGYVRRWPDYQDHWESRHLAYAVQWFALAGLTAAIYLVFLWKRRPKARGPG